MFLKFANDTERKKYGKTAFIEFQYCRMNTNADIDKILSIDNLPFWNYDGALFVFVDEEVKFLKMYRELLGECQYNNKNYGLYDTYGVNYFKPECIDQIIERIQDKKPEEYEIFTEWLEGAKAFNGFYLLGL